MAEKYIVLESVEGKIVESRIVDGDLDVIVKEVAREALEKWVPSESNDFVVTRDDREWDLAGEDQEIVEWLRRKGVVEEKDGRLVARIPFFLISYDNRSFGDMYYEEYGVYVVTLYIGEDYRILIEEFAAGLTSKKKKG